jgi:hypothetical protein
MSLLSRIERGKRWSGLETRDRGRLQVAIIPPLLDRLDTLACSRRKPDRCVVGVEAGSAGESSELPRMSGSRQGRQEPFLASVLRHSRWIQGNLFGEIHPCFSTTSEILFDINPS